MATTTLNKNSETEAIERIVNGVNELVEKFDTFKQAGYLIWREINSLGKLDYGDQARIIRKVAEHPNLKYPPQQIKIAFNTFRKFPEKLGETSHPLPSWHYAVLANSRLTQGEMEDFEKQAIKNSWSNRQLKQAIQAHKAENKPDYPDWLQYGNCWKFPACDPRFGLEGHPGRIPGQITQNLLHFYTDENDLFVSCFAGSGTDIDVCNHMGRKCIAYDLIPSRKDINKTDLTRGIPLDPGVADFVFFDPPWLSAQKKKYSNELIDFANLTFEDFYDRIDNLANEASRVLKTYKHCAFIAANMPGWGEINFEDVGFELYQIFKKYFQPVQRISIPYPTNMIGGGRAAVSISRARKKKYMLAAFADLCVFKKV